MAVEQILFDVAEALRYPVIILALASLALALVEAGILVAELYQRRNRSTAKLETAVVASRQAVLNNDPLAAKATLGAVSWSKPMREVMDSVVDQNHHPDPGVWMAKQMADYDHRCLKRLERTRILVRAGPALGLMGTLIPLSPALQGLADGDTETLAENLQVAFGITVVGLIIGAIAFATSLVRDRLYSQDYSDVEYVAAELGPDRVNSGADAQNHAGGYANVTPQPQPASPRPSLANPAPSAHPGAVPVYPPQPGAPPMSAPDTSSGY